VYAGHIGVALGAHGIRKAIPLWLLIIASQLPDWADAGLCLANIRPAVPGLYSHSFPAVAVLALIAALVYCIKVRDPAGMFIVAVVVVSHAVLDYVTGTKPTWIGGPVVGLGLYHHPVIDFAIEAMVLIAGWLFYRQSLPEDRRSSTPVFTLLGALLAIQAAADIFFSFATGLRKC
jgi:membrane-bound metal-dependent hydrolase YbcI (DUF457 family)